MPGVTAAQATSKMNHFGIEVLDGITWQGWEPGREYTKNLVLKNVKVKTQKIKYKVPSTRFFNTIYPQPVMLSAGTSFTLPVTFRPLEKLVYEDRIRFETTDGQFEVPIKAVLPVVDIRVQSTLQLPMCAAQDFVQTTLQITNNSELVTPFQWDVSEPFLLEPIEGTLEPWASYTLTVTFKPKSAVVYEVEAICRYGPEFSHSKSTKLQGIGKYPHLLVSAGNRPSTEASGSQSETVLNFGTVAIGEQVEKWIDIQNLSPVNAPFRVEQPTGLSRIDTVFSSPQKHGVVPAMGTIKIPIQFSPNTLYTTSIDYFHVVAIGNISKSILKCVGSSQGPAVTLSHTVINFLQVDAGQTGTKTITVTNQSDVEAVFQFCIDSHESVFKFEAKSGTLKPNSKQTIVIRFQPHIPINYYRRISCLVHNQDPIFLDMLGTCHTETGKPAVLQAKHIALYKQHVSRGLSFHPPEQLNELLHDGKLQLDESGALMHPQAESLESLCQPLPVIPPMDDYVNDGYYSDITHSPPHVSVDVHEADFGRCTDLKLIEQRTVNLTNHTKGKITVAWMGDSSHVFSVSPVEVDIPPLKSYSFRITFKPNAPNQFFGAELECYAYYKSLRDYRLVEDITHSPPWCLTVVTTGHTFMPNHETFLPRYTIDSPKLVFPAVNTNEATYRTLLLTNTGTTPIMYDFEKDTNNIFTMKPTRGLLGQGHQIFVVKILPNEVKTYRQTLNLKLNEADKNTQEVLVWGSAEAAQILLENNAEMFYKPTCVNTASHKQYWVKNLSRIPLRFEWKMHHADSKILSVEPAMGIIQPNETQYHQWSFVPKTQQKYVMKPSLIVWGQGMNAHSSAGKKRQFTLRALGEGSFGEIEAEQTYLDFGTVVVGSSASKQISLLNNSNCSIRYQLLVEETISGPYPEEITRNDNIALVLDKTAGILPARSKHIINATIKPYRRVSYQFTVSYQLLTPEVNEDQTAAGEPQHLVHLLAQGVFPTMAITDARCYGSALGISKKQLWSLFSLDNLNMCLDSDPSAEELTYTVATRHSHRRRMPVYTRAILDFNFSAAPVGSKPCVVQLMVENTGAVPTQWEFLFPTDLQLELEYWAETGEYDEDELHEMKVMDNKLFTIEPRRGDLEPGECATITFSYKHIMAGTDRLPVLLKLTRGREVLFNFTGVTVERDRRYVHFSSNKFLFAPVPIGEKSSPKQIYEMYNGGAVPVKYIIDTTNLELVTQENFDHEVFQCLNPVGEIQPGQTAAIEWVFSPLEAKTYMVDIPIKIDKGDMALITFTGVGFDKRQLGDTMPLTDQPELSGVPSVQSVSVPGQLLYLSLERISFGNLPLFSQARQMVVVTNKSPNHDVSFAWHATAKKDTKFISIQPTRGFLPPGDAAICTVIFTACDSPAFYDLDLICEVVDETEMNKYRRNLKTWEDERERQTYEFTITEDDLDADKRIADLAERPPSSRLRSLEYGKPPAEEEITHRYKTLPPIQKTTTSDEEKKRERLQRKFDEIFWQKPVAPDPFLLHLGVTSRTHDITEFQANFSAETKNYYIDRILSERLTGSDEMTTEHMLVSDQMTVCRQAEAEVVAGALTSVLRGLLDDADFHEGVEILAKEPVPYFRQFGDKPATPAASGADDLFPLTPPPSKDRSPVSSMHSSEGEGVELNQWEAEKEEELTPLSVRSATPETELLLPKDSAESGRKTPSPTLAVDMPTSSRPLPTAAELAIRAEEEKKQAQIEEIKRNPVFGNALESVLADTVGNIIQEAFRQEFNITARPRLIALPPKSSNTPHRHT